MTTIYFFCKGGAPFKPTDLDGHAFWCVFYPCSNGVDLWGKTVAKSHKVREILKGFPNVIVLPPDHQPLNQDQVNAFDSCGITIDATNDRSYDVGVKLHAAHGLDWMHPENPQIYEIVGTVEGIIKGPDAPAPTNPLPVSITQNPSTANPSSS